MILDGGRAVAKNGSDKVTGIANCQFLDERRKVEFAPVRSSKAILSKILRSRDAGEAISRMSFALEANDTSIDDLLTLLDVLDLYPPSAETAEHALQSDEDGALALKARALMDERQRIYQVLPAQLRDERITSLLLSLFIEETHGKAVSMKCACILSGVPDTTALRCLLRLEQSGLIVRSSSRRDRRVTKVGLTEEGKRTVRKMLGAAFD